MTKIYITFWPIQVGFLYKSYVCTITHTRDFYDLKMFEEKPGFFKIKD